MHNNEIRRNADLLLDGTNSMAKKMRMFQEQAKTYGYIETNITLEYLQGKIVSKLWNTCFDQKDKVKFPLIIAEIFENYDMLSKDDIGLIQTTCYDDADDNSRHAILALMDHISHLQHVESTADYITWYGELTCLMNFHPEWRHLTINRAQSAMRSFVAEHGYPVLAAAGEGSADLTSLHSLLNILTENTNTAWWGYLFDILDLQDQHFRLLLPCAVLTATRKEELNKISSAIDSMIGHLPAPAILHYVDDVAVNLCKRIVEDLDMCFSGNCIVRSEVAYAKHDILTTLFQHSCVRDNYPPSFDSQIRTLHAKALVRTICAASDLATLQHAHAELQNMKIADNAISDYFMRTLAENIMIEDAAMLYDPKTGVDLPPLFAPLLDLYFSLEAKLRDIELYVSVPNDDELDLN